MFFFFKQKTAFEFLSGLVGSEMCIRDGCSGPMSDKKVAAKLGDFLCMGVNNDDAGRAVWERYKVNSVPSVLFICPQGAVIDVLPGYVMTEQVLLDLGRVPAGQGLSRITL